MKNILIYTNVDKDKNLEITKKLAQLLKSNSKNVFLNFRGETKESLDFEYIKLEQLEEKAIEVIISIGGDGTILGLSRDIYDFDIPILGINLGRVGFLAEVEVKDMEQIISMLEKEEYEIEERIMVESEIERKGEKIKNIGLNDIVINRGSFSRMVEIEIHINGKYLDKYFADGVIISTPTGSTAYNMAAGGPILMPDAHMLVITPVCPYSLGARPIVVSYNHEICIKVNEVIISESEIPMLTVDGQKGISLDENDIIKIKKADKSVKLIKLKGVNYYEILRKKIQ